MRMYCKTIFDMNPLQYVWSVEYDFLKNDQKQLHRLRTSHLFLTILFPRCSKPVHVVCIKEKSISGFNRIMNQQDRQIMYKHNIMAPCFHHCCSGKAISITYSECYL